MKKYFILTSVLALTACGGGSGSGGSAPIIPGAPVVPSENEFLVSKDSGLTMIDINTVRASNYERAIKTVQAIESGNNINGGSIVSRAAVAQRNAANSNASDYTIYDINAAYQTMYDILIGGNLDGKTNRDVLLALALSGMQQSDIINFLKDINGGGTDLTDNIKFFIDVLAGDDKNDEIARIISQADIAYKDFGKEFKVTLENAKFDRTIDGGYFTFVFDENGDIKSLTEIDGEHEAYATIGGGHFRKEKKGTEYRCEVPMGGGNSIDANVFVSYDEELSEEAIKERLLNVLKIHIYNDEDGSTLDRVEKYLSDMKMISYKDECTDGNGCVISAPVDYSDGILVESRGKELGLKYSDFGLLISTATFRPGHVDIDDTITEIDKEIVYHEYGVFAGGYEDKEANAPTKDMTFSGLAYAGVTTKRNDWVDANDYHEPQLAQYDGTATLTVSAENGPLVQKLVADFSDAGWYTVVVDDMNTTNQDVLHFNGTSRDANFAYGTGNGDFENSGIKYYGPDKDTPTEATGFIQYVERDENAQTDSDWGYKVDLSFGVKRD